MVGSLCAIFICPCPPQFGGFKDGQPAVPMRDSGSWLSLSVRICLGPTWRTNAMCSSLFHLIWSSLREEKQWAFLKSTVRWTNSQLPGAKDHSWSRAKSLKEKVGHLKAPVYTAEFIKPCTWTGQDPCSEKTQEDLKLSLWWFLHSVEAGNEGYGRAVNNLAKHWRSSPRHNTQPWTHYTKWKKSDMKINIVYDCTIWNIHNR